MQDFLGQWDQEHGEAVLVLREHKEPFSALYIMGLRQHQQDIRSWGIHG